MNIASLPFIRARWFTAIPASAPRRRIRLVVIHDMEFPETTNAAEVIAHDFATRTIKNKGSAHINVDSNSAVRCVRDKDVAYAAPGANSDGLQMELAGFGRQTRGQWLDEYGQAMLAIAIDLVAQWCVIYDIPPTHLTDLQLADKGERGIIGHYQASKVFHLSDHTDPGPGFPWDVFILGVGAQVSGARTPGKRRWSGYFGKWITLVEYRSDTDWTFRVDGSPGVLKAQTPWSQMPTRPGP